MKNLHDLCYTPSCSIEIRRFFDENLDEEAGGFFGLTVILVLSLAACCGKKPSLEGVEQAIGAGTLTIEDALDKGWVDEAWVEQYLKEHSVPASDKMEEYQVGPFTTTTVSGKKIANEQVRNVALFTFVEPETEGEVSVFEEMEAVFPDVEKVGAELILRLKDEAQTEQFADAPFPVIKQVVIGKFNMQPYLLSLE